MLRVLEVNVDDHLYGGVYVLVKNMIANLPSDITADIAALEPFDDDKHIKELEKYGSKVYYVGSKRNKILKQLDIYKNVKKIVERNKYDVVHLHSDVSHKILVSALAARRAGKLVFHSHSNDAEGKHITIRRAFHKICCLFLKMIPAQYVATSLEAGKWMFPWATDNQITVLDNGISYNRFGFDEAKRKKKRTELALQNEDFVIGLFGRFVYPKNPFFAIDILEEMQRKDNNVKLLSIGEGPLKQDFIRELEEKKLTERAIIIGNTDTIEDYYQAIDALIMPSNFEGFGLVAVEAQISGTPTIVSNNVPKKTRISDLIHYLPINEDSVNHWCEALEKSKLYKKHSIINEIDKKYELKKLIEKIVEIYGKNVSSLKNEINKEE